MIHSKIIECMREVGAISKNKTNQQQGYKYRGIEDFMNACHPIFAKHGVYVQTKIVNVSREDRVSNKGSALIYTMMTAQFTFIAEDGSSATTEVVGEGMDSGDKSSNKALSAAFKYALAQLMVVPYAMIDSEIESPIVAAKSDDLQNLRVKYGQMLMAKVADPDQRYKLEARENWDAAKYESGIKYLSTL